jgi:hypothetical protein
VDNIKLQEQVLPDNININSNDENIDKIDYDPMEDF